METVMRLLKPLILPLLKLDPKPPHLPEGSSLVRELKPSGAWLSFRYLSVLFGVLSQVVAVGVIAFTAVTGLGRPGFAIEVVLGALEVGIIAFALVVTRVDWEMRHYLVGDRSLRVSLGALTRREVTVSYANVQNLEVTQGPLERLFGFKTLTLSTAGAAPEPDAKGENLHVIRMPGLESADSLRELMLGMLKNERDTGLGEPQAADRSRHGLSESRLAEVRDAARALEAAAAQRG